ncbi:MAG: catalase-peroxidase, partial [Acidipropionibacterium acidipropionici]|nr:catalase-peroxidase [Acidipropionibacterium acidipropionici]
MSGQGGDPADSCEPRLPHPTQGQANHEHWPNKLNLKLLSENADVINPLDPGFDYKHEFENLDYDALKSDIRELLTTSQDWWPADFGNYGPMIIRV